MNKPSHLLLTIVFLISILTRCEKENSPNWPPDASYFDGFEMLETLNGHVDVSLTPEIKFTAGKQIGVEGELYKEYIVNITLFNASGDVMDHFSKQLLGPETKTISLKPLLQNKKYYYKVSLVKYYCEDDISCLWPDQSYRLELPDIYSFNTIALDGIKTVTDEEDNVYETTKVGEDEWFIQNLKTTLYSNGTHIFDDQANRIEVSESSPNFYNSTIAYPFYVTQEPANVCPENWHVATKGDFESLIKHLEDKYGSEYGYALNITENNETYLANSLVVLNVGTYWTSDSFDDALAYGFSQYLISGSLGLKYSLQQELQIRTDEFCIRCVKNNIKSPLE